MSITYPTSPAWAYPVVQRLEFDTGILVGDNGTEQRWPRIAGRESVTLTYPRISLTDRDTLLATFETAKGDVDQTISLTVFGETLTGMHFDAPKLSFTESANGWWNGSVTLKQVVRTPDTGVLAASFPALTGGYVCQLPFTHEREFLTTAVLTEGGRYAYAKRATSLMRWSVGGGCLSDTDAAAIWSYFSRARGRWKAFKFTDPDSETEYTSCRFAEDAIEHRYLGPDENAIEVRIVQIP